MSQFLLVGGFRWLTSEEMNEIMNDPSRIRSCTLEVDLEYPQELHEFHSDYPLAPDTINGK